MCDRWTYACLLIGLRKILKTLAAMTKEMQEERDYWDCVPTEQGKREVKLYSFFLAWVKECHKVTLAEGLSEKAMNMSRDLHRYMVYRFGRLKKGKSVPPLLSV